jgi:hypothetical protein
MTITLTGPVIVGLATLLVLQVAQLVMIGRWTGRIQLLVERHEQGQAKLEASQDAHAVRLASLDTQVATHATEIVGLRTARHEHASRLAGLDKMVELVWKRFEDQREGTT